MSNKPKFTAITTPAGAAIFPKLNTPDTKYKPLGEYATKFKLSGEDAQPIIDQYESELAAYFEQVKADMTAEAQRDPKKKGAIMAKVKALKLAADKPYKPAFDDDGNETGEYIFNAKMPARIAREGKADLVLKPDFFDAGGKKLATAPEIWGGSKLKLALQLRPFNAPIGVGLSLRLQAVQIIELRSAGQRDASGYGFGAEEGYEGSDEDSTTETPFGGDSASSEGTGGEQAPNGDF